MGNDLTVSLRLTADNKDLVVAARESSTAIDTIAESSRRTTSEAQKLNETLKNQNAQMATVADVAKMHNAQLALSADGVQKLLDRYDPLGAKLRQLQGDFRALDAAASSGNVGSRDDARLDAVYAKLQQEINAAQGAAAGFGVAANDAFVATAGAAEKSMFATVQARRELIVLGHEAISGNFSRMPGSMMVLAERTNFSAASLLGLGGAFVAAAAGAAVMGVAYAQGTEEMKEMNRALALTSDFSGQTRGSLRSLAADISASSQLTIGQSKEVVTELAASGRIGAEAFGAVAGLVSVYAKATGKDAAEATPEIVKMFSDPTKGAEELNRSMHFLSATEMERIATLQRTGRETEAQIALADALSKKLKEQQEPVGALESAWTSMKKAASSAWDSMLGIGREQTLEEKLKEQQALLKRYSAELAAGVNVPQAREGASKAQAAIDDIGSRKAAEEGIAAANGILAKKNAYDQETASLRNGNSELYRRKQIQEEIDRLKNSRVAPGSEAEKYNNDAIAQLQKQLAPKKENLNPHLAGVDSDFQAALQAQNAAWKSGAIDIEAYRERVAALISTKTELGRKLVKEDEPFSLNKAIEEANKDLDKQRDEYAKSGVAKNQKLLDATRKNNISLIQDARERAYAEFDIEKDKWLKIIGAQQEALALYAEGSDGRADAAKRLAELEVSYAKWTQSEIGKINKQTQGEFGKYIDSMKTPTQGFESMTVRAFKNMEDALVNFVTKGKLSFKSLADGIIADLVRIQMQESITKPLAEAVKNSGGFSGMFSNAGSMISDFFGGGRASGGPVDAGTLYQVNENGPELLSAGGKDYLMMGGNGGFVTPITAPSSGAPAARQTSADTAPQIVYSPAITIDARGADAGVEQRINQGIKQFVAQNQRLFVAIVDQAYAKRGIRSGLSA